MNERLAETKDQLQKSNVGLSGLHSDRQITGIRMRQISVSTIVDGCTAVELLCRSSVALSTAWAVVQIEEWYVQHLCNKTRRSWV